MPGSGVAVPRCRRRSICRQVHRRESRDALGGATRKIRKYLGFALLPQSGVAVGLILLVQADPSLGTLQLLFLEIGLTSVMINEFAGSVGRDPGIREQLYNAETAAHAHDVLHAEASEGFNYYLTE